MKGGSKGGFTFIEVMVAIVLIGLGIATMTSGLGSLTASFRRSLEREETERLAQNKYDELIATGEYTTATDGELDDPRYPGATWSVESQATSIDNLNYVRVTVSMRDGARTASVEGLSYVPPTSTDPAGGGQ